MEMSRDERRKKACSDFFATMTIEWEYLGRTKWTTKHGPEGYEHWVEHDKSRFRYTVTWGDDNTFSFILQYVGGDMEWDDVESIEDEDEIDEWINRIEMTDLEGIRPSFRWSNYLDRYRLFDQTDRESGPGIVRGEIVPDWLNIPRLILHG